MKIGLIFPNKNRKDKAVHLGLGYIAAYSRTVHDNLDFSILDTRIASKKESKLFFSSEFDLIGITVLSPVYFEVVEIFKLLKQTHFDVPICLGGPYVTTIMQNIFLETPADFGVYGEGEITFSEIISYLKGRVRIESINGLMYKSEIGYVTNPPREQIFDLDKLPYPAYDLFHMERYPMHRIVTSRGCPYKCVFCNSSSIWLGKWRKRSAENIIQEIEFLIKNYKRKVFYFSDNSFNIDLKRVELFCKMLIEKDIKILWSTPVRADIITERIAILMKKSGCYNVGIGIESANNRILELMEKKTTIEDMQTGINIFKKAGIEVLGQFVIGSPGDTKETIKESIEYAAQSNLDFIMFYSILPYMDTDLWNFISSKGSFRSKSIHNYHRIKPRIVFETPEFSYRERLEVIKLAEKAGYYSDSNDKSILFDFGKDIAMKFQNLFPEFVSDKLYLLMKNVYRKWF